jgi:NTP pyrophosphatase (non-canonical NTP hydrolase)
MRLDFKEYSLLAERTINKELRNQDLIVNGCMGLCGEAGETIDVLKKSMFQGHDLNRTKMMDELGDVLWYINETAKGLSISLECIAEWNIEKLKRRYPEGFDTEKSVHRTE